MKFLELIEKLDKSEENEAYVDLENIAEDLDINLYNYIKQDRLKSYWILHWYCIDSWVGTKAYFFDNEFVCYSVQTGRKSDEEFEWISMEAAKKVRDYIFSLMEVRENNLYINLMDKEEDVLDGYYLYCVEEVVGRKHWERALYNGESFEFIESIKEVPDYGVGKKIRIKLKDGTIKEVKMKDILFKYNIKE